ncbi:MAG: VWA domain-containing protein [Lachnospiraceae bacterium]|nr:VWA domain-containing protein [Lachnospiraceae bacterium]
MIFESLWPLVFLAAVPVIIILYLLKPKGKDHLISSNLLWQKLLKNEQSKTFFEKFVHNILMYLQILIVILLVVALMSPYIRTEGQSGGRKILLLDTSGSMQHMTVSGKTRLEEAVEQACDYVRMAEDTRFSIVTEDSLGTKILAVDMADTDSLLRTLQDIRCSDSGGNLSKAQGTLDALMGDDAENAADLIVYTDGAGASGFEELRSNAQKELRVFGEASSNVANEYTVFTPREDGSYDVMVSMVNYSDSKAAFDVSLYDEGEKLIALKQMQLAPSESAFCLFEQVDWQGQTLKSCIDGIIFEVGGADSLNGDNVSEAVKSQKTQVNGLLVGEGNIFIEKAYLAITGESIARAGTDALDNYNVVIYDAGQIPRTKGKNRLIFGAANGAVETLENVVLNIKDCDLSAGLSGFTIGVNTACCFALPEGAESFLEYNGKCVGYYQELEDSKEIVVGFDPRESDFPLRAEFPVFLTNAMVYLTDTSWLTENVYYAGEEITLKPWAEPDVRSFDPQPAKAGLYQVGNGEYQETYVVRFQTATESDGRETADSVGSVENSKLQKVKRAVRNLFILLALAFLIIEWIVYVRQMRYRGKFYLIVRGAVAVCVVLALLGIQVQLGSSRTATVFVVDLSDSNEEHLEEADKYLQSVIAKMPAANAYGIVTFGKNALVDQFLTEEDYYGGLLTLPEKTATNFEDAISKALTLIPGDYSGRLVMLTDGKETRGDIWHMGQALLASNAEFLTLLYEDEEITDAYIDSVGLPSYLHPGDKYAITVLVESNYETDAVIEIYNGSVRTASNSVHLNRGSNRFVFSAQVDADTDSGAMENIMVQVHADADACPENDSFSAYSVVESAPKVLLIAGQGVEISEFDSVLRAAGCNYHVVSTLNAPDSINAMLDYKSIILADTYIDDLPAGFLENLETYVKDYGCGFICCGGEDSFALGGYRNTVLETVLPVDMQPRSVNEIPSMAMVMVIDHSGSMISEAADYTNVSDLDIAIRAAAVAVDNLRDSDYVGILTFDDQYEWQVELRMADDKETIKDELMQISEGGGTTIKPALMEACEVISKSDASIKHVVLLTDGMGETDNFQDVISAYAEDGITLSTVAVGSSSDTQLLEQLADGCGGRYYYSDISSDIPKIFAREVFLGSESYIQNGVFPLKVQKNHELTSNLFADGWPVLYGYIAATPKTASSPVIVSDDKENPILTVWQYGLGRTAAWNSDVTGEWSGAFVGKDDYVQMWKRIVDYSTGNADMGGDRVDVATSEEQTEITYQTDDYKSGTEILVTVIDPAGNSSEEKLYAVAPGKYTSELSTPQTGLYHFNIHRSEEGEIQSYLTMAAAVQFSDEYKFDVSTESYLQFVEQYGRMITEEDSVFTRISTGARESYILTNWLLLFAICLFVADVALRRFQLAPKKLYRRSGKREKTAEDMSQYPNTSKEDITENDTLRKDSLGNVEKKKREVRKSKKAERSEQTLDTSELLKKKDDRKI